MERDSYRRIAKWYDRVLEPMNAPLRPIGLKMYPPQPGMAVLDVGCGTGSYLAQYLEVGCRGFGIDSSPAMLERAKQRLEGRAELLLGDATRLPYEDASFDLIVAATLLHELDGPTRAAALAEMARTLKPEGRVLVIDYRPGRLRVKGRLLRSFSLVAERVAGRTHVRNFRSFMAAGGVPAMLEDSGLTLEKDRIVGGGNLGLFLLRLSDMPAKP